MSTHDRRLSAAVDFGTFDSIESRANLLSEMWSAVAWAANLGEVDIIEAFCRRIAVLTRECFAEVKALGAGQADGGRHE